MRFRAFVAMLSVGMCLTGCAENMLLTSKESSNRAPQIEPTLYQASKADYMDKEDVTLPANYDPSNYRKIKLAVSFYPLDSNEVSKFSKKQSKTVAAVLEAQMAKLKRFTVLARSQLAEQARRDEKRYQDKHAVTDNLMRLGRESGADYVLTCGIALTNESYDRIKYQELFFNVKVVYELIDLKTNQVVDADPDIEGRAKRTFYQAPNGVYIGGFNANDPRAMELALNEASFRALSIVANRLGNRLPVGGKVRGIVGGEMLSLDAGAAQGLMGDQVGVLYADYMGVDIPLAYVELHPAKNGKTSGTIFRWNDRKVAKDLIKQVKADGMAFLRDYDAYVVSCAMPLPPEWEKNYKN